MSECKSVPMYEAQYVVRRVDLASEHFVAIGEAPEVYAARRLRGAVIDVLGEFPSFHQIESRHTNAGLEVTMYVPIDEPHPGESFKSWFRPARDGRRCLMSISENDQ